MQQQVELAVEVEVVWLDYEDEGIIKGYLLIKKVIREVGGELSRGHGRRGA